MISQNSGYAFLLALTTAAYSWAAPTGLLKGATSRDAEVMSTIVESMEKDGFPLKPATSKLGVKRLESGQDLVKGYSLNPKSGMANVKTYEIPLRPSDTGTVVEVELPLPKIESSEARSPSEIANKTIKLEVDAQSSLHMDKLVLSENRTVRVNFEGVNQRIEHRDININQQTTLDPKTGDLQFVYSKVSDDYGWGIVFLNKDGTLNVLSNNSGSGYQHKFVFNPKDSKSVPEMADFMKRHPDAKLISGYLTSVDRNLVLTYKDSNGKIYEISYGLPAPMNDPFYSSSKQKFNYIVSRGVGTDQKTLTVHEISGRESNSASNVKGLGSTAQTGGSF